MSRAGLIGRLREYYEGSSEEAEHFRYGLLIFDIATILFIVVTSFTPRSLYIEIADVVIGVLILADFGARFLIDRQRMRTFFHPVNVAEIVAIISFLAPLAGEGLGFLRVLRTVRLLRTYRTLQVLRQDFRFFRVHEEIVIASVNLGVFVFVMTALVYETQRFTNQDIGNYADALYFTVTALTTTGFGDITLPGTWGRLLSVIIMIFGVTLFLRLAQVLFRPNKVTFECPECGLLRHEPDAVHCKHCGTTIHIATEGHG